MKGTFLQKGLVFKGLVSDLKGYFHLERWLRETLIKFHVGVYDTCCAANNGAQRPVTFNDGLQYFDGTSWVTVDSFQSVTSVSAHAGGGQGSATALVSGYNEVTTVATAGDSVKLPGAVDGGLVTVKNDGVAAMDVFPATGDTINDGTVNVAISVAPGVTVTFRAVNATNWETNNQVIATDSIVAQTAGGQVTFSGGITTGGAVIFGGTPQTLTGAGAVSLTTYATLLVTTGANALTLAAGSNGQKKFIKMKTDGGDGTLTPSALQGGTTITFNDAGDFVELVFMDSTWNILTNSGATVA